MYSVRLWFDEETLPAVEGRLTLTLRYTHYFQCEPPRCLRNDKFRVDPKLRILALPAACSFSFLQDWIALRLAIELGANLGLLPPTTHDAGHKAIAG